MFHLGTKRTAKVQASFQGFQISTTNLGVNRGELFDSKGNFIVMASAAEFTTFYLIHSDLISPSVHFKNIVVADFACKKSTM